jgi:GAF domain-containing protein
MIDHRFETLLKLIARINSQSSLDELLGSIMESAKKLNHAEASSLMLADDENKELIIAIPTGPAQAEISGLRIPQDKGIAGWVKTNNNPAIVNNPESDKRFLGEISKSSFKTKNLICVPLRNARGGVIGVLQSINHLDSDAFEEDDLTLLQALADQAALAIEKENYHQKEIKAQRVTEQLNTARNIQQQFLPTSFPQLAGYKLYGESVPALEVGGDYFDFFDFGDGRVGFVVADVGRNCC